MRVSEGVDPGEIIMTASLNINTGILGDSDVGDNVMLMTS